MWWFIMLNHACIAIARSSTGPAGEKKRLYTVEEIFSRCNSSPSLN